MNTLFPFILICLLPAIVAPAVWLMFRILTNSTKYAWAVAIAVGYVAGHVSLISWQLVPEGEWTTQVGAWAKSLPVAFQSVVWPQTAIDWLPIGLLLAALVSVNAAAFPMPGITMGGAILISIWLGLQLVGGKSAVVDGFTTDIGIRLGVGTLTMLACWLSVQKSIQGRSRWLWISITFIMTIAVATILALSGSEDYSILAAVLVFAQVGSLLVSLPNSGTDNVRFAGATVAVASISLLVAAWVFASLPWYPIPFIAIGFLAINIWLPEFATGVVARVSLSVVCALAAVGVTVFIK